MLAKVKEALRIKTNAYDSQLNGLIQAAVIDLDIAGIDSDHGVDSIIEVAIITYCQLHFGQPDDYDHLKASYDEQKAQLSMSTGYTVWTGQTS